MSDRQRNFCETCNFWRPNQVHLPSPGECRIRGPVVHVLGDGELYTAFPETLPELWCGEHSGGQPMEAIGDVGEPKYEFVPGTTFEASP